MNIKSNETTPSVTSNSFKVLNLSTTLVSMTTTSLLLAMSYGYIALNAAPILIGYTLSIILYNLSLLKSTQEYAQSLIDAGFQVLLARSPIVMPISIVLLLMTVVTLVTGNLYLWYVYIGYVVVASIIRKTHDNRLGVIQKSDKEK